jgi:predicted XRE-type DNA-binding protein
MVCPQAYLGSDCNRFAGQNPKDG